MNKILQIVAPGRAEWLDADIPSPAATEAVVKVKGVTTCPHWDIHMMDGEPMFPGAELSYPLPPGLPGHEATGEVVAVGTEVTDIHVGDAVAIWRDPGNRKQGCYARYVSVEASDLLRIHSSLAPDEIASLELAMCVQGSFFQLLQRNALHGKRVAIAGLGPSGLIAVQLAKAYGAAEVIGIDLLESRKNEALALGADSVLDPIHDPYPDSRNSPNSFDTALDTTGLKVSIENLMAGTRKTVAIFGVLRDTITFGPPQWFGDFALLGYATHTREAAQAAYNLIMDGKLTLKPLVQATLPFTEYAEAVQLLRDKKAQKVLFLPWMQDE